MNISRLTVGARKELLLEVIREKTWGKMTEQQLFNLVNSLNINNQYTIIVEEDPEKYLGRLTMRDVENYVFVEKAIINADGKVTTLEGYSYLGGINQRAQTVLGSPVLFGRTTTRHYGDKTRLEESKFRVYFNEEETGAIMVQTTSNYLSDDGAVRDYKVRYDIIIYLPKK